MQNIRLSIGGVVALTDYKALTFDCYSTLIDWELGIASPQIEQPVPQRSRRLFDNSSSGALNSDIKSLCLAHGIETKFNATSLRRTGAQALADARPSSSAVAISTLSGYARRSRKL
jgi:hypothetical protein